MTTLRPCGIEVVSATDPNVDDTTLVPGDRVTDYSTVVLYVSLFGILRFKTQRIDAAR